MLRKISILTLSALLLFAACEKEPALPNADPSEENAGGETTVFGAFSSLFEQPAPNLNTTEFDLHADGDAAFEATFVTAPATINPGLGPFFNNTSCAACHGKNGRSPFPASGTDLGGLLLRISLPGEGVHGSPMPLNGYGGQLQQRAIFGKAPEAEVSIAFVETVVTFADGESVTLRQPVFSLENPANGALPAGFLVSPRIAPPVIGLGLLEAISEADILGFADETDADGDGISGKANYVWDFLNEKTSLGRFGWKAGQPHLYQQTAAAYSEDIGITSPLFPVESCAGQSGCDDAPDDPEISIETLHAATFYSQSLGVPARRGMNDEQVLLGKQVFMKANCDACHRPTFTTGQHPEYGFLSQQKIYPYTDMLLHDMGEGLADERPEFLANGREWRTPPLWGIGLTPIVNGHSNFLHDGRANSLLEAVMWHGGEAEAARGYVEELSGKEREALVAFLESL